MTHDDIRLGTRGSELALWQADTVADLLSREAPSRDVEIVRVKTLGDRVQDAKLSELGRTAVFTAELDRALLDGSVHLAVHSLKDVETIDAEGIVIAAVLPRGPVEDVLVAPDPFESLPAGAKVGTGSVRRAAQLRLLRPDLVVEGIRGNVPTRLEKLDRGEYDALVMARAGLVRLGLAHRISSVFSPEQMLPAVGQGAICVTVRADDEATRRIVGGLNHAATWHAVRAERACLSRIGAGCNVPLGVSCVLEGDELVFRAGVFSPGGGEPVRAELRRPVDEDPAAVGQAAGDALLEAGASRILEEVRGG